MENRYKLSFSGARMVTLSACDTNVGGWDPSATYSSLSRAFSTAGAPTIIASLWSVSDESTRDTMEVFYRELAAGQTKAEALRRAQLSVMCNPRFANPFYWAPFVILGDWRQLKAEADGNCDQDGGHIVRGEAQPYAGANARGRIFK